MRESARYCNAAARSRSSILVAGFCMQLALGAVYGWSVFVNPLREQFGASRLDVNLTFTITLMVLGVAAGFGGYLQRRFGPRAIATAAGVLYGAGVFLSGCATDLATLYLSHGLLGGIGLGLGYIVPLAVLIGWFPDKRGLITGLAVTGFGLGALVTGPLATQLIQTIGVQHTLMLLGVMYLLIVVLAAQFLVAAPEGYAASARASSTHGLPTATAHATLPEALRTPHWYVLWLMLAVNVTAGAAIISVAAPLAQELTRVSSTTAALAVCLVALFNGAGRLFWGAMSDRFGRPRAFLAIFLSQVLAFALIPEIGDFVPLLFPLALIALCYGGGFGIMPAFATDVFGSRHSGTIYGAMLTAWSAGAVAGPVLISALPYRTALSLIALLLAVATVLPLMFNALVQLKLKASLPDRAGLDAMAS